MWCWGGIICVSHKIRLSLLFVWHGEGLDIATFNTRDPVTRNDGVLSQVNLNIRIIDCRAPAFWFIKFDVGTVAVIGIKMIIWQIFNLYIIFTLVVGTARDWRHRSWDGFWWAEATSSFLLNQFLIRGACLIAICLTFPVPCYTVTLIANCAVGNFLFTLSTW